MAEKDRDPPSTLRSLAVLTIIAITAFILLSPFIAEFILVIIIPIAVLFFYFRIFYRYLADRRGYQNRYQRTGQELQNQQQIIRILGLGVITIVFYGLVSYILQWLGYSNPPVVFAGTMILMVIMVKVIDYYAGKDMEEYVEYKEKRHNQYVDSLGKAEGICMSCRRKVDPDERFCPYCGYERHEREPDSSYTGS